MIYELNGKNIKIPDDVIATSMRLLDISKAEAVQMYLEDEGLIENAEVEALTKKAKTNRIPRNAKAETAKRTVTRERKPDEEKEKIIEMVANFLKSAGIETEITNKSKIIEFKMGENHYKFDLIKQRPPKSDKN